MTDPITPALALLPVLRNEDGGFESVKNLPGVDAKTFSVTITAAECKTLITALEALQSGEWVAVPREPTTAMCDAALAAKRGIPGGLPVASIYRAMIGAK